MMGAAIIWCCEYAGAWQPASLYPWMKMGVEA